MIIVYIALVLLWHWWLWAVTMMTIYSVLRLVSYWNCGRNPYVSCRVMYIWWVRRLCFLFLYFYHNLFVFFFLNIIKTQNVMMIFCSIRTLLMRFVLIIFIRDPHHCRCCVNDDNKSISLIPKRDWGNLCVSHNHCGWAMTGQIRCWYLKTMYKNILVISVWEI